MDILGDRLTEDPTLMWAKQYHDEMQAKSNEFKAMGESFEFFESYMDLAKPALITRMFGGTIVNKVKTFTTDAQKILGSWDTVVKKYSSMSAVSHEHDLPPTDQAAAPAAALISNCFCVFFLGGAPQCITHCTLPPYWLGSSCIATSGES